MRGTVVFKAHPPAGQAQLAGQHVKMVQAGLLARPEVKVDDIGQVAPAEARVEVQQRVLSLWEQVTTENLFTLTDYAGFKQEFRSLFGFEVPGVDYAQPVETAVALD